MAKICKQCGREFENRSVRCPICRLDLVSSEVGNSGTARTQNQQVQQAQALQTRQMQVRQPQGRQMQVRQPQGRQEQVRQAQAGQESINKGEISAYAGGITRNIADNNEKKSVLTVRNVLRILSMVCLAMVFCPAFLVSCADERMEVSVMTAVSGVSAYGEEIVAPYPAMLICLAIPIIIFALLFVKRSAVRKNGILIAISGAADFIIWMLFKSAVQEAAEENYCSFETTGWYTLNMVVLALIVLLAVLVVVRRLRMDGNLADTG